MTRFARPVQSKRFGVVGIPRAGRQRHRYLVAVRTPRRGAPRESAVWPPGRHNRRWLAGPSLCVGLPEGRAVPRDDRTGLGGYSDRSRTGLVGERDAAPPACVARGPRDGHLPDRPLSLRGDVAACPKHDLGAKGVPTGRTPYEREGVHPTGVYIASTCTNAFETFRPFRRFGPGAQFGCLVPPDA
jgi:hypothetical protein